MSKDILNQFNEALKDRAKRGHFAEITFIGVNKADIKEHKKVGNILNVTVDFIAEVITCIRESANLSASTAGIRISLSPL